MKSFTLLLIALTGLMLLSTTAQAQLFSQNFSSSTVVADYVSATPNNGQFNDINTSGAGTVISINSGTLQFARTADTGIFARTTDLSAPPPSAILYKVDVTVSGNSVLTQPAAFFQVGSNFGTGFATETSTNTYAQFGITFTTTAGTFRVRNGATDSADFSGTQTITWALNNSGSTLSYLAPDASTETVANDTADIWVGTTKIFNDVAVTTATQQITDLKFVFQSGAGTIQIDNIQVTAPLADGLFYRSVATGNWNSSTTWESSADNVTFSPATHPPSSDSDSVTIRSPNVVTVSSGVVMDQVVVDSGAQVTVASTVTPTLANGPGTDLTINGTWLNSGGTWTVTGATWTVGSTGTYIHNTTSSAATPLGNATFDNLSTMIYRGSSTLSPAVSLSGRSFGNLSFESSSGSWSNTPTGGGGLTINRDLSIGSGVTITNQLTGATSIAGNFTNNGTLTNSTGTQIYTFTGSGKTISGSGAISFETFNVNSGASITATSAFTQTSGFTGTINGTLIAEAAITNSGTMNVNGTFQVNQGGSATGNAFAYGSNAILSYNGTSAQTSTNVEFPSSSGPANVTVNNAGGLLLHASRTLSGTLTLTSGTLSIGANTLTLNGAIDASGGGTLTGGATSNVTFGGSGASTTLPAVSGGLNNLIINRANGIALGGGVTVAGTLTLTNGAFANGANLTLGNAPTISRDLGSLSAAPTFGSTVNVIYTGTTAVTTGNEIPTTSTVLNNLTISKSGGVTLGANATVNGVLALNFDLTTISANDPITSSFVLTENGTSTGTADVIGTVERSDVGGGPVAFGNSNVQFSNGSPMTLQVLLVKSAPTGFPGAVTRTYSLHVVSGAVTLATVRLRYLDAELNTNVGSDLHLWRADGDPAATWVDQGTPSSTQTAADPNNWIQNTGVTGFSSWTMADGSDGNAPTAVRLTKFSAASFSDGVQLNWESGYEVNNLGYHLYREQNGKRTRLTPAVVAGSALKVGPHAQLTAGYSYSWFDRNGTGDTAYYLESIDLNGTREVTGPIYPLQSAGASSVARKNPALLLKDVGASQGISDSDYLSTGKTNAGPANLHGSTNLSLADLKSAQSSTSLETQQAIAAGRAVKIPVAHSGWYRITQPELVAAGWDQNSDARNLQLFADGEQVPVRINSVDQSTLSAIDSIEFYGVALDTPSTDKHVYWLVNGATPGERIDGKRTKAKPGNQNWAYGFPETGSFAYTIERRDKMVYFAGLLNGEGQNIFGPPVTAEPATQTLSLRNIDRRTASQAELAIALQGLTAGEHIVAVKLNGSNIGTISLDGTQHVARNFAIDAALLHEGENALTLSAMGGETDVTLIDSVGITYKHSYTADDNSLRFSANGGQPLMVGGFTSADIRVIDITDPGSPQEVTPILGRVANEYAFKLSVPGTTPRSYVAFTDDLALHAVPTANEPSHLSSAQSADLLIVTHKDLRSAVEPLAAQRRNEGLAVTIVDVEDVYDEFSYGAHTPSALRAFLGYASHHWQRAPQYLLLVGDSSWDPRNYLDQGDGDLVPTKLIDTAYMETASDDWLADFNNDGVADIAVGRLPGRTSNDVSRMVAKILLYEQERQLDTPLRSALMVADSGFETKSLATAGLLPLNMTVQSVNRGEGADDVIRGQIINGINSGPLLVNYFGHGSVTVWTGAGLLDSDLAANLTNNKPSLFVMMTCLNGYSHDAYIDSLAESLLKAQNGGAMAVWASSGFPEAQPQFVLSQQFYQQVFSGSKRLGDATKAAKTSTQDTDVRRTWLLLGDPSMRLR